MRARRWLIGTGVLLAVLAVVAVVMLRQLEPRVRRDVERALATRLDAHVTLERLQLTLWPAPRIIGGGLAIRHQGRTDFPPLIAIHQFSGYTSWSGLMRREMTEVHLDGLEVTIPPQRRAQMPPGLGGKRPGSETQKDEANSAATTSTSAPTAPGPVPADKKARDEARRGDSGPPFSITLLRTTNARLAIMPRQADKDPRMFDIFALAIHDLTFTAPSTFEADLTNPIPEGRIVVTNGKFGPWSRTEPAATPVGGEFTFAADLGTIKGIAGQLDAEGRFEGPLDQIVASGTTKTPDFRIPKLKAAALPLQTTFRALVDGTNGDVQLHQVDITLGQSVLQASGEVVGTKGIKGKRVTLDVVGSDVKMTDLLSFTVRTSPPAMTGTLTMKSSFDLPRGEGDVLDRLRLAGSLTIARAQFTTDTVQDRIDDLSRRARGRPKDLAIDDVSSNIRANFSLADGTVSLRNVTYRVRGATVAMSGRYGLESGRLNFTGTARLEASVSETQTGFKHFLLKPFDPLFRKGGSGTRLALKIGGTIDEPDIGLDLKRSLKGK
ncbi:MAG: hypothetical protein IT178_18740 [Acidobacteria bacterium]|nr:hypothetical protein [Acidobacteriota bacterium]